MIFLLLFVVAMLAGALNSVAGGGSFLAFPTLIFTGVLPITANATTTVALWPGSVASVGAYRKELRGQGHTLLLLLITMSMLGGVLGATLLLHTPQATFIQILPYLMLLATLLFTFSNKITKYLRRHTMPKEDLSWRAFVGVGFSQLLVAIYGGYFGGGIGILMLASLGMIGMDNIHVMNGLKTLLASSINGVAVIIFVIARAVIWPQAIVMLVGAIIGGYFGAFYARKLDQRIVRALVVVVGLSMTTYFFVHK